MTAVEWRQNIWGPVVMDALNAIEIASSKDKKMLEIGFGGGSFAVYLASYGINVHAIEHTDKRLDEAIQYSKDCGVEDRCEFQVRDFFDLDEQYDLVVLKSVLYSISDVKTYEAWIKQLSQLIKPTCELLVIENGSGNKLVKFY